MNTKWGVKEYEELRKRMALEAELENYKYEQQQSNRDHLYSKESAVWIPLLLSLITFALVTVAFTVEIWLWQYNNAVAWGIKIGFGVLLLSWFYLVFRWLMHTAPDKRISASSMLQHGNLQLQGETKYLVAEIRVSHYDKLGNYQRGQVALLPTDEERGWSIDDKQFNRFMLELQRNKYDWAESLYVSDIVSRSQLVGIRNIFISREWAEWINPNQHSSGVRTLPLGEQVIDAYADNPTLLPYDDPQLVVQ